MSVTSLQKHIGNLQENADNSSTISTITSIAERLGLHKKISSLDIFEDTGNLCIGIDDEICNNMYSEAEILSLLEEVTVYKLISFIFNRRFGWSENGKLVKRRNSTLSQKVAEQQEEEQVLLDKLIYWLSCQKIQKILIESLTSCIKNAKDKPVVRNQTCIHLMEWFKFQLNHYDAVETFRDLYPFIKSAILLTIQDIWSAIRNACVVRLGRVVQYFSLGQVHDLFNELVIICNTPTSTWQSIEGAIMGLHVIIKNLQWKNVDDGSTQQKYSLNFGKEELECMPTFVSSEMYQTVFRLLSNSQSTIREYATKAFTAYISRCDLSDAISCLSNVVEALCKGIDMKRYPLPHNAVMDPNYKFLDAYEAEGLLGVCVYLIKSIPPSKMLSCRQIYFSAFSLYLMHPASTVRQATSNVLKYMVAKDSSSPDTLRFILQSLCCDWVPNMDVLLSSKHLPNIPRHSVTTASKSGVQVSACWEWREGRLLAYELIMQFLIKNHWLYTFGTSHLPDNIESPRGQPPQRRKSLSDDKKVHASLSNPVIQKHSKDPVSQIRRADESSRTRTNSFTSHSKAVPVSKNERNEDITPQPHSKLNKPPSKRAKARFSIAGDSPAQELGISKYVRQEHNQVLSSSVGASDMCKSTNPRKRRIHRLATVSGYNNASSHTTGKHFSYYDNNEKDQPFNSTEITSLLMACQAIQHNTNKKVMSPRTVDKQTSHISNPCEIYGANSSANTYRSNGDCILEDLSVLFERIFYQTVECLADVRWELRRMAQQLLGCVVEVIRWYDMKVLEDLWDNQLKSETTLLSFGVCEALKYSIAHAARLNHMIISTPSSWQDVKLCEHVIMQIVDPVRLKVGVWSQSVYMVLQERTDYDKFTAVAMDTLMLVQSHFELLTGQKYAQLNRMVSVIKELFSVSHPYSDICKTLLKSRLWKHFSTPSEGFLCCCIRKETNEVAQARQIEKYLLTELGHTLPYFLKVADNNTTHILLPILCYYLGFYVQDDKLNKYLIDCITSLCGSILHRLNTLGGTQSDSYKQYTLKATEQLHLQLANNSLDEHTFKQLCEIYAVVCALLPVNLYFPTLVQILAPKVTLKNVHQSQPSIKPACDVVVQHIPLAPILDGQQSSEDEEDQIDLCVGHISESQMLNSSVNSTGSGHHNVNDEDDSENSDWDSWDDEEGKDEDFTEAITELFLKLQKIINNKQDSKLNFNDYVNQLPSKEKQIVCFLLKLQL